MFSILNACYVFRRTRQYRLFQANVEQGPGTPSAQRVRVQSSPASSSPLRMLSDMLSSETAESRAHPDGTRDVWELGLWDPRPICLSAMIYFSPLHALLYTLELPLDPMEPRPSVAVFRCLIVQAGLSALLQLLQSTNDQKQKDSAIIQKEVLHEYDTKFVQPRLYPVVRDVATQVAMDEDPSGEQDSVVSGTPTTLIRRSFQTHPNPNYLRHIDPDNVGALQPSSSISPNPFASSAKSRRSDSFTLSRNFRSRPSVSGTPTAPTMAAVSTGSSNTNFGGSLGAFTHPSSPLKKATSMDDIGSEGGFFSPRNSRELAALEQREAAQRMLRRISPAKEDRRHTTDTSRRPQPVEESPVPAINPFAKARADAYKYERFPSRR